MTDRELDGLMRRVLMDAIRKDEEAAAEETEPFVPSRKHRRQMKAMCKDPLHWMRNRTRPVWKKLAHRAAAVLLIASVSLGGMMAVSPTVRAAVIRWVTEWYETHIVYRYFGEKAVSEIPQYVITKLPEGYVENKEKRIQMPEYGRVLYENDKQQWIWLRYVYVQQGAALVVDIEGAEIRDIQINGYSGHLILSENFEEADNTVTWIDTDEGIQFTIDGHIDAQAILDIAESVSLENITKNDFLKK